MDNDIPAERRWRYANAAAEESRTADLLTTAKTAAADARLLLATGEVRLAGGATTVMIRAMLLHAATPAGSESTPAEVDIRIKRRSAKTLELAGASLAAAMVRAAAAEDAAAMGSLSVRAPREDAP
ncbi:hypothetical protein [Lichenibacterium dinghuense]|uniref:hypothetical protein n=1 Tax=Lichenibacterium dinghuense TaxID=2895977 RepID=UPI001F348460|nr:hypothetical protein [Lichenibacterium sp. 6Y81]